MKRMLGGVVTCALVLSGCANSPQDVPVFTPSPISAPSVGPTPVAAQTPTQAELSAMAEASYRAFFAEWTRLELAGGAEEPTPALLENGGGDYLRAVMALLREQKETRTIITGATNTKVVPAPGGSFAGVDPRLTLRVCEDHSTGSYTRDGVTNPGDILEGVIYFELADGRARAIAGQTEPVIQCSF